ncbi:MAG: hypothetical protein A3F31_05480 [Candidatus Levybacteria bacterium RIFCSPHIGHO2_12_FULL_38_12]|nr:MAG: hypothetical protein A2770_02540 [Candidatus Levybacteria bacterium RIFCSPHIGHO2_01_FULL_38_12]OGH22467.1 MAG: hypothetical protein A3F31_05480 [Candidatus Levybacteria bacterium RIFCSPHIGHO2_12_FULL_38_12]OGH44379.1 MAG: hypothetical protein A3J14_02245 [Candidatus Levybacteria bacterium RIFCSPLOWO2_02_FULL_37_18]
MKKLLLILVLFALFLNVHIHVFAVENPLDVPNNRFGIHILFTDELQKSAKLINSNGGDWGYVTIPIQSGDRNLLKWQKFMDESRNLHVVPIIRLASEGDYFNTKVWRKPNPFDIVDFANFLNSLDWPTKNRYVVVFNEVNRADEWGGNVSPNEYADLLNFAIQTFKARSDDFFIISAGLDNASANTNFSLDEYTFLQQMYASFPEVLSEVDGMASHSYPNPAFSQPPSLKTAHSITSFLYEQSYIKNLTGKSLPIFITETGWDKNKVSEQIIANYFTQSFTDIWTENVVAITPFLLSASAGPFEQFSFLNRDNSPSQMYAAVEQFPKTKGNPVLAQNVLGEAINPTKIPLKQFKAVLNQNITVQISESIKTLIRWFIKR